MSLSDTNLPSEGPDTTMDSPLKLSYERPSSPDFSLCSSSSSPGQHSPSPLPRSPSPASFSNRSTSPQMCLSSPTSPQSPISSSYSSIGPPASPPNFPFLGSSTTSPHSYHVPYNFPILSPRSPSPPQRSSCLSSPSPSSPQQAFSPPSPTSPYRARSLSPLNYHVSPPQSPLPLSNSPYQYTNPPPSPMVRSPSPYQAPYTDGSFSPSYMEHSPSHSTSRESIHGSVQSQGLSKPTCSLQMESASPPLPKPFYSLSPKSERSDTKSPIPLPSPSPTLPSITTTTTTTTTVTTTSINVSEDSPIVVDHQAPFRSTSPRPPEVVDVDQGQPCIVDLTCEEDDDDVEIVSPDPPVVFIGSETSSRRRNKKRVRHESQLRSSVPPSVSEEPIVINDTIQENSGDTSATAIDVSDSPETALHSSSAAEVSGNEGPLVGTINPPQLFGDLLNQPVVPVEHEHGSASRVSCTCIPIEGGSRHVSVPLGFCGIHGLAPSRLVERAPRGDRSRSPLHQDFTSRSVIEAPIPQDVLEDIASLCAESVRSPSPFSRFFMDARRSGSGDHGLPMRLETRLTQWRPVIPYNNANTTPPVSFPPQISSHSHAPPVVATAPCSSSSVEDSGGFSCAICFESSQEIKKEGKSISSTVCGHIFCTLCLEASFRRAKQCPTCRKRLNKKQYHRIYI